MRLNTIKKEGLTSDQLIERREHKLRRYSAYVYSRSSELRKSGWAAPLIKKTVEEEVATFDSPAPSIPRLSRRQSSEEVKVDGVLRENF